MIRVGNDKLLIDDKELKRLVKEGYDRGVIFGCKVNATKKPRKKVYHSYCRFKKNTYLCNRNRER